MVCEPLRWGRRQDRHGGAGGRLFHSIHSFSIQTRAGRFCAAASQPEARMDTHYQTFKSLTLAGARAVRDRAAARASDQALAIAIVVVDASGRLFLAEAADRATPGAMD